MKVFKQIKDLFARTDVTALFSALEIAGAPWADETKPLQYASLGRLYWMRSRKKILTSFIVEEKEDNDTDLDEYATDLLILYGDKWTRLWELFLMEYNPIENYNMIESGSDTNTKTGSLDRSGAITRTGSLDRSGAITKSGTESVSDDITYSGKEANTRSGYIEDTGAKADNQTEQDNKIYGYNSSTGVNSDSSSQQASHKNRQTFNDVKDETTFTNRTDSRDITTTFTDRADTDSRKDTYNNIADTDTRKDTYNNIKDTASHSLTRSGNIGVTTSQQMMESELELRRNIYFNIIFADIDKLLTLSIY